MESLFTDAILRDKEDVDAEEILCGFKEFLLVFYGAQWSPKSYDIAEKINTLVMEHNPDEDNMPPLIEVLYISNDTSKSEFKSFYN